MTRDATDYDVVVVGSGFGGTLAAGPLVDAGLDVLLVERGPWVPRGPHNWDPDGTLEVTPYHSADGRRAGGPGRGGEVATTACVGGPSVFYGGVSFRFREEDFDPGPEITGDSGARWPLGYRDLRPHYARAERILGVTGRAGDDPTEPPREGPYPAEPGELSAVSRGLAETARGMGLRPFRLPLAINRGQDGGRTSCVDCNTCDTFACAVGAKNDLAVSVLPDLIRRGLELRPNTAVTDLDAAGGRVREVELVDRRTAVRSSVSARAVVLAAGALGTPRLLMASGLRDRNLAGGAVGRYLTRHCSAIAFGFFPGVPDDHDVFHKQVGINDFYFGDPGGSARTNGGGRGRRTNGGPEPSKLGNLQQVQTPANGVIRSALPDALANALQPAARRLVGLLALAEDAPREENRVELDPSREDATGLPEIAVHHTYAGRDLAARDALIDRARTILRRAGAAFSYTHEIDTFSHALGTVRMGEDPETAPLAPDGRYRGVENLWVTDGSALPTSGGVNPSLTIAANALRVGRGIAGRLRERDGTTRVRVGEG
ncbi:MAG: GMC family oxidoreductase [Candidatus Palauibacterales bacterium]|nr:GMC family oxidoreductase [Candidatus Palauibacterales bacterium]